MIDLAAVTFVLVLLLIVVRYGSGPEVIGGQIMIAVVSFGFLRGTLADGPVDGFDALGLFADGFAFVAFLWIALFAWRLWPIWTASLQLLAIGAHFGPALDLPIAPLAYAIMRSAPTIVAIITLLGATWLHRRRVRSGDNTPPWRTWSGPLNQISPIQWQNGSSRGTAR